MSVSAVVEFRATATEVLEGNPDSASPGNRTVTHALFNVAKTLDATSTPPVTKTANQIVTLVAGQFDLDLTALIGSNAAPVDGTGLKLQYMRVTNLGANDLTLAPGPSNGYTAFGSSVTVKPGGTVGMYAPDNLADVSGTAKIIRFTGTGTQTSQVTVLLG